MESYEIQAARRSRPAVKITNLRNGHDVPAVLRMHGRRFRRVLVQRQVRPEFGLVRAFPF